MEAGPVLLPPLGLGTAALGDRRVESDRVLEAAWSQGIAYFDTAPHYGFGLAEQRLGAFLAGKPRDSFIVSTKVGRLIVPPEAAAGRRIEGGADGDRPLVSVRDQSADGIRRSLDGSLQRLGLDRVDVVLLHDPDPYPGETFSQSIPALMELREQGVVRAVGVGTNQTGLATRLVRETGISIVLIAGRYTLLDRIAAEQLLPACRDHGVTVIAGGVFNSGLLAAPAHGVTYDYQQAAPDLVECAQAMQAACERAGVSLPAAALQFALRHPAVATAVIGARTPQEVVANGRGAAAAIPDELWDALDALEQGVHARLASGRWR